MATILIVEDMPVNQLVTRRILEKNDYEVEIAENGLIAFEMALSLIHI